MHPTLRIEVFPGEHQPRVEMVRGEIERLRAGEGVHDYVAVSSSGKPLGPPRKNYADAKAEADRSGGYVKFAMEVAADYVAVSSSGRPLGPVHKNYADAKAEADRSGGYVKFAAEAGEPSSDPKEREERAFAYWMGLGQQSGAMRDMTPEEHLAAATRAERDAKVDDREARSSKLSPRDKQQRLVNAAVYRGIARAHRELAGRKRLTPIGASESPLDAVTSGLQAVQALKGTSDFDSMRAAIEHERAEGATHTAEIRGVTFILWPDPHAKGPNRYLGRALYYRHGKYHVEKRATPVTTTEAVPLASRRAAENGEQSRQDFADDLYHLGRDGYTDGLVNSDVSFDNASDVLAKYKGATLGPFIDAQVDEQARLYREQIEEELKGGHGKSMGTVTEFIGWVDGHKDRPRSAAHRKQLTDKYIGSFKQGLRERLRKGLADYWEQLKEDRAGERRGVARAKETAEVAHDRGKRKAPARGKPVARDSHPALPVPPTIQCKMDDGTLRSALAASKKLGPIRDAKDVHRVLWPKLGGVRQEVFGVLLFDVRNQCIGWSEVAKGPIDHVEVPLTKIHGLVVKFEPHHYIVVHNHPSGMADPSVSDGSLTRDIEQGSKPWARECAFVDHVIIGLDQCYSFADQTLYIRKGGKWVGKKLPPPKK